MKNLMLITLLVLALACQDDATMKMSGDLEIGLAQTGSLQKETPKTYAIELDSNAFVLGAVEQISVDVIVKLLDESGEVIGEFDGPAEGPEMFAFSIPKTGKYSLVVEPFKEGEGDYSIRIDKVEPIAVEPAKRVDQLLYFYSGNNPGAVVAVLKDGEVVFSKAYGKANMTHGIDFTLKTPTNIGSVSKQFTAFAILLLEQQGLLSLDDDVRKHIPEFPDFGEVITIKNLLNHTNGLREVYNLLPIAGWAGEDKLLRSEILATLQKQKALQDAPGEKFNYNNSAFILLADIVERKTDSKYPDWLKNNVFEPLGMADSYVRENPSQIIPGASQGYSQQEIGLVESGDLYAAYGAGGIYTTPADLLKWLNNFNDPQLGGQEVLDALVTPGILNDGDTMSYALGIGVGERKGLKRYAHTGADIAHRAAMMYFPEINSGVIALSNNASFSTSIAFQIADLFLEDYYTEEEAAAEAEEETEEKTAENFVVDIETLEKYKGKYRAEAIGLIIEYKLEEDQLKAYATGQPPLNLKPVSEGLFAYDGVEATVVFNEAEDGEISSATHTQGGQDISLEKLPPFDPTLRELQAYEGKYYCEELETFYTIVVKDSALYAQHKNLKEIKFSPIEEDTFSGDVFFMSEAAFKRDANGVINSFYVSNGRTRDVEFLKQ